MFMGCIAVTDQAAILAGPYIGIFRETRFQVLHVSARQPPRQAVRAFFYEKLTVTQLDKKFPAFYENLRLFTRPQPLDSILSHIKISLIPVLYSHLILSLSTCLFLSGFPSKVLHELRFYFVYGTCSVQFIFLDLIILTILGEQ
jgi:hypothetical protein